MATLAEVRTKHPEYDDMSDAELASALHKKFYSDIPLDDFHKKVGFDTTKYEAENPLQSLAASPVGAMVHGAAKSLGGIEQGLPRLLSYIASYGGRVKGPISDAMDTLSSKADEVNAGSEKAYESARFGTGREGLDVGELLGEVASPANYGIGRLIGRLPAATGVAGKVGQGVLAGAASGAVQPVDDTENYADEKAKQIAFGGALGGSLPAVTGAASRIMNPKSLTPGVQKLLDLGVRLTPGQIMGGGLKGAEDTISSIPLVGGFQKAAMSRGIEDLNRAVMAETLAPLGVRLPKSVPVGRQGVEYVASKIGDKYDSLLQTASGAVDPSLVNDLKTVATAAQGEGVTNDVLRRYKSVLKAQLFDKASANGTYSGDTLKGVQSELRRLSGEYGSSDSHDTRILGDLIDQTHDAFQSMIGRLNPGHAPELAKADAAWARFVRLRRAASAQGAKEGVFSASHFANAVKASDRSVGKGNYAKGKALFQDISDPAQSILPSSVPDSGTAGRLMTGTLIGGMHMAPFVSPAAIPLATASAMYTKPGVALMRALLTGRSPAVRGAGQALGNANPALMSVPLVSLLAGMGGNQ